MFYIGHKEVVLGGVGGGLSYLFSLKFKERLSLIPKIAEAAIIILKTISLYPFSVTYPVSLTGLLQTKRTKSRHHFGFRLLCFLVYKSKENCCGTSRKTKTPWCQLNSFAFLIKLYHYFSQIFLNTTNLLSQVKKKLLTKFLFETFLS